MHYQHDACSKLQALVLSSRETEEVLIFRTSKKSHGYFFSQLVTKRFSVHKNMLRICKLVVMIFHLDLYMLKVSVLVSV